VALHDSKRDWVAIGVLRVDHKSGRRLDGQEQFLGAFIHRDGEAAMWRIDRTVGGIVTLLLVRPDGEIVGRVAVYAVDVAGEGIDIQAAVFRNLGVRTTDDALGLGESGLLGR